MGGECALIKYRRYRGEGDRFKREAGYESALFVSPYQKTNKVAIVVEGEFDAISLTQLGFPNAVSISVGASGYKPEWADFFESFRQIFLSFDTDEKGDQGVPEVLNIS